MLKEKDAIKHFVHIDIFDKGLLTKKKKTSLTSDHNWELSLGSSSYL